MTARPSLSAKNTYCSGVRSAILFTALLASPAALAFAGCSSGEDLDPVPATTATTTTTTGSGGADPGPTGSPPKRTILVRNPVGAPPNNLLVDGDFELSVSRGGGQYGWRMFNSQGTGEVAMTVETGGLCRSGLTCVKLEKGNLMFGRGTAAPDGKGHVAGMFAKLPEGATCNDIDLIVVDCDTFGVLKKINAEPELDQGWCHYAGTFGPAKAAVCLYVQNSLDPGQVALVDAAVLGPNDGTVPYKSVPDEPLGAATLATMANVRDLVRRTQPFGRPVPTAAPPRD